MFWLNRIWLEIFCLYFAVQNLSSCLSFNSSCDSSDPHRRCRRRPRNNDYDQDFDEISSTVVGRYSRYNEILDWLDSLCRNYPEIVHTYDLGKTSEGRAMVLIQLGFKRFSGKWSVWLDGGIHGGEHISPATIIYIAHRLVKGYLSRDHEVLRMLERIDWYLLPVVNPDGYEFSHIQNVNWRKNRRPITKSCIGVDLNRNWKIGWGGADSNPEPCSPMFMGDEPETEAEVKNIANFLRPRSTEFLAFITYHSYGQRIFSRWDHTDQDPEDNDDLMSLGNKISDAISDTHGKDYKFGKAAKLTYPYGGGSADWAKAELGIKYSYLIELRDTGYHKFQLPVKEIIPTGMENWAGIKELGSHIIAHHGHRNKTMIHGHMTGLRKCNHPKAAFYSGESARGSGAPQTNSILSLHLVFMIIVLKSIVIQLKVFYMID